MTEIQFFRSIEMKCLLKDHRRDTHTLELGTRQRVALLLDSPSILFEEALAMDVVDIDGDFLINHCCKRQHLLAAELTANDLLSMRVTAAHLRRMGVDALDLVEDRFVLNELIEAYGPAAVREIFVSTGRDAVAVAVGGPLALAALQIDVNDLLRLCAGDRKHATCVLLALQPVDLWVVDPGVLLATGLRCTELSRVGVRLSEMLTAKWDGGMLLRFGYNCL